jgi:6-phosphofructokinase 1
VAELLDQAARRRPGANMIGLEEGRMRLTPVEDFPRLVDLEHRRPADQWWMGLRGLVHELSHAPT